MSCFSSTQIVSDSNHCIKYKPLVVVAVADPELSLFCQLVVVDAKFHLFYQDLISTYIDRYKQQLANIYKQLQLTLSGCGTKLLIPPRVSPSPIYFLQLPGGVDGLPPVPVEPLPLGHELVTPLQIPLCIVELPPGVAVSLPLGLVDKPLPPGRGLLSSSSTYCHRYSLFSNKHNIFQQPCLVWSWTDLIHYHTLSHSDWNKFIKALNGNIKKYYQRYSDIVFQNIHGTINLHDLQVSLDILLLKSPVVLAIAEVDLSKLLLCHHPGYVLVRGKQLNPINGKIRVNVLIKEGVVVEEVSPGQG